MIKQVIVSGGLGNQMFQYAFYRSLKARGIECRLNTDLYYHTKMHNGFELERVFGIKDEIARNSRFKSLIIRLIMHFPNSSLCFKEDRYVYNPSVYNCKSYIFHGTWINEGYFESISADILEAFSFKGIDSFNSELSNRMQSENSVSIHIRRGDYLKIDALNVCDEEYYRNAISYIKSKIDLPFFYVFSDDSAWADSFIKGFNIDYKVINHNTGDNSYKDLFLMSSCRNNINANSTFSWWAAWLNKYGRKIVIMPKYWTLNTDKNPACDSWIKL